MRKRGVSKESSGIAGISVGSTDPVTEQRRGEMVAASGLEPET
ncbi:MAG: hypothetical protein ACKOB4_15395 [Acidobacteriota bacterium]